MLKSNHAFIMDHHLVPHCGELILKETLGLFSATGGLAQTLTETVNIYKGACTQNALPDKTCILVSSLSVNHLLS